MTYISKSAVKSCMETLVKHTDEKTIDMFLEALSSLRDDFNEEAKKRLESKEKKGKDDFLVHYAVSSFFTSFFMELKVVFNKVGLLPEDERLTKLWSTCVNLNFLNEPQTGIMPGARITGGLKKD